MATKRRTLYTIRESSDWPIQRWERLKEVARLRGITISALLAECILPVLHQQRWVEHDIKQIEDAVNKRDPE